MANEPEIKNPALQDWYAEGRAKGYLAKNPAIHDWVAEGVKKGYLKDLSGGTDYTDPTPPVDPTLSAQEAFDTGADAPDPRDPYARKGRVRVSQPSTATTLRSARANVVFDDTKRPAVPKPSPVSAAVQRYAKSIYDAIAPFSLVSPHTVSGTEISKDDFENVKLAPGALRDFYPTGTKQKDGDVNSGVTQQPVLYKDEWGGLTRVKPRGLTYPIATVPGAVTAPVSNSVRNFTQGALAPGLRRIGDRDTYTALSAIQDIFGDIPGNIKAGARAVLNDSGAEAIGKQVPELAPGTMAGDILNTATTIGSDPLNLLLAPTGANLPGVRALSVAGKEAGLAGIAEEFAKSMRASGPNVLQKAEQGVRNTAYAGARKTAEVVGDAVYRRGKFAPEVESGKIASTKRIPKGAVRVKAEPTAYERAQAVKTEDATAPVVNRGRVIEGKTNEGTEVRPAIRGSSGTEEGERVGSVGASDSPRRSNRGTGGITGPREAIQSSARGIRERYSVNAGEDIITTEETRNGSVQASQPKVVGSGSEGVTYTPDDNTPVPYRWRVVEADSLKPSQTDTFAPAPDYPQELQRRDRTRLASQAQVSEIVQGLNPARLMDAPTTADGAPVIGSDNFVESGNGRTLALRRAYNQHPAQSAAYKAAVLAQAPQVGIDPSEIARMAKPVLVRERVGDLDLPARAALAEKMGKSTVAGMSEPEIAANDGKLLRDSPALTRYAQGADILSTANNDFRRAFVEMLPQNERAGLMQSDGTMSAQGVRRVRNALIASAYDDSNAISRLTEETDDNIKSVGQAMEQTAPMVARVRSMTAKGELDPAFDITPEVSRAASTLSNLRAQNETVAGHLAQGALFGDETTPVGEELLKLFDDHKRRPKIITDTIAQYVRGWELAGRPGDAALFDLDRPDAHALLRAARTFAEEKNGTQATKTAQTADLFQSESGAEPAKSSGGAASSPNRKPAEVSAKDTGQTAPKTTARKVDTADAEVKPPAKKRTKKTSTPKAQNETPATQTKGALSPREKELINQYIDGAKKIAGGADPAELNGFSRIGGAKYSAEASDILYLSNPRIKIGDAWYNTGGGAGVIYHEIGHALVEKIGEGSKEVADFYLHAKKVADAPGLTESGKWAIAYAPTPIEFVSQLYSMVMEYPSDMAKYFPEEYKWIQAQAARFNFPINKVVAPSVKTTVRPSGQGRAISASTSSSLASPLRTPARTALPANSVQPGTVPARITISPLPGGDSARKIADITATLSKALGKNIAQDTRVASRREKNVGGHYYPGDSSIVVSSTNDLDTIAHDLAHWVDDHTGMVAAWVDTTKGASPFDAELIPAFSEHGSKPPITLSLGTDAQGKPIPVKAEDLKNGAQVQGPFDILHSTDPVTSKDLWTVQNKQTGAATTFTALDDAKSYTKDMSRFEGESLVITRAEGVAEWLRAYLLNPDAARAAAPGFTAYYESHVPEKIKGALRAFGDAARQHAALSDGDKIGAAMESLEEPKPPLLTLLKNMIPDTMEGVRDFLAGTDSLGRYKTSGFDWLRERVTDEFAPSSSAYDELVRRLGKTGEFDILPKDNPIELLRAFPYFKQKMDAMFEHGVTDNNDEVVGKPIMSIFEPLETPNMAEPELRKETWEGLKLGVAETVADDARKIDAKTQELLNEAAKRIQERLDEKIDAIETVGAKRVATRIKEVSIREKTRAGVLSQQAKGRAARKIVAQSAARKSVKGKARVVRRVQGQLAQQQSRRVLVTQNRIAGKVIPTKNAVEEIVAERVAKARAQMATYQGKLEARLTDSAELRKSRIIGAGAGSDRYEDRADVIAKNHIANLQATDPAAYARYSEFNARLRAQANDVLLYMARKGRYTDEEVAKIMAEGTHWITLQRVMDEMSPRKLGELRPVKIGGRSIVASKDILFGRKGSLRTQRNPIAAIMEQMYAGVKEADTNEIKAKIAALIPEPGRQMYGAKAPDVSDIVRFARAGEEGARKFYDKGEVKYLKFEEGFDRSLDRAGEVFLPNVLEFLGMLPAKLKRFTATRTPGYFARNIIRDRTERLENSRTAEPFTIRGIKEEWFNSFKPSSEEERFAMKLLGGHIAETRVAESATDFYNAQRLILRQAAKNTNKPKVLQKVIAAINLPGRLEAGEAFTRTLEYRTALRYAKEAGLDDANARVYAAGQARNTLDFNRGGTWAKVVNRYIAFTNSAIQGNVRTFAPIYEAYKRGDKAGAAKAAAKAGVRAGFKLAGRIAFLSALPAVAGLLYVAAQGKEKLEEWREFPPYIRDMFIMIPYGPDSWIAYPKTHLTGVIGSAAERALDYAMGNTHALDGYATSVLGSLVPFDGQQMIAGGEFKTAIELAANYDFFRQGNIISPFENDRALENRPGTVRASRLGKTIGKVVNSDPRKVDFVLNEHLGDYGRLAQAASDIGRADKPRNVKDSLRRLGGFLRESPGSNAQSVQRATQATKLAGIAKDPIKDEKDAYYGAITNEEKDAAARALRAAARSPVVGTAVDKALARRRETNRIMGPATPANAAARRSFSSTLTGMIKRLIGAGAPEDSAATIKEAADLAKASMELKDAKVQAWIRTHGGRIPDEGRIKTLKSKATHQIRNAKTPEDINKRVRIMEKQGR